MSNEDEAMVGEFQASLGRMVSTLMTTIIYTVGRGYLLYLGWMWFIVPLHAPKISIFHAIGIAVALGIVHNRLPSIVDVFEHNEKRKRISNAEMSKAHFFQFMSFILWSLIVLGMMYFAHRVM